MKEAAGEANMTVITIILIGIVMAVALPLINSIMQNSEKQSCCISAGGTWDGGKCSDYNSGEYNSCVKH